MTYYLSYLPVLLGAAVFFVLAVTLWLTGRRALANSRGGLDWVKEYRTDGFEFSKQRLTCANRDFLCLFAVVVFSIVFSTMTALLRSHYDTGSWFTEFFALKTFCKLMVYAAGAFAVCWLLQDLFRDNTLAVCGGILFAASFVGSHTSMSLLAISLLLLLRWFVQDDDAPLFPGVLLLLASNLLLAMAASRMIGLTWVAIGYLVVHIYKSIRRSSAVPGRAWEVFVMPLLGVLFWLAAYLVSMLGVLFVVGLLKVDGLGSVLNLSYLLRLLLRVFRVPLTIFRGLIYRGLLLFPIADAPILMLGLFGFFVSVRTAVDRHEPSALISALLLLLFGVTWVFSRQYCLLLGLLLCSVCLLRRFTVAQKSVPVIVYTAISCAYYLILYILTYLVRVSPAIAEVLA